MSTGTGSPTDQPSTGTIFRVQVIAISIVGAAAVILFLVSRFVEGDMAGFLARIAGILAVVCAVIGITFALTARKARR